MESYEEIIKQNQILKEENEKLKLELEETREHLKKYTAPASKKAYYEAHKEEIKQKVKEYKQNTNYKYEPSPEKKKEYARRAYLKKKEKTKQEILEKEKMENIKEL